VLLLPERNAGERNGGCENDQPEHYLLGTASVRR
jgi:hypothetical protein